MTTTKARPSCISLFALLLTASAYWVYQVNRKLQEVDEAVATVTLPLLSLAVARNALVRLTPYVMRRFGLF